MTGKKRGAARLIAITVSAAMALPAHAVLVFDPLNFIANVGSKIYLSQISHELHNKGSGTINYYTKNIDDHTVKIHTTAVEISETTNEILNITKQYNEWNYDIYNDFTWIINNGGPEIIPIPGPVKDRLNAILNGASVDDYTRHFKDAASFGDMPEGGYRDDAAMAGSRARKAANDALVHAVKFEQEAFAIEFDDLVKTAELSRSAQGQGHQLQIANALAGSQVHQMMKLRSMVLVSEAARAAEAQVDADNDARAIAIGNHMRDGLDEAISQSLAPQAMR